MQAKNESPDDQLHLAQSFRSLHRKGNFFVIPNAWDVPSARVFEEAGFSSVATSSAGMLASLGYQDGEGIPRNEFVFAVRKIAHALSVPLSVDMMAGFGDSVEEVVDSVRAVINAGAVGFNLEDFDSARSKFVDSQEQCEKIRTLRILSEEMGIPFTINARTDAISRKGKLDFEQSFQEAIMRSELYKESGADCVYPMGLTDFDSISLFVKSVNFPTNIMIRRGIPEINQLKKCGVTRLSFGPAASYAALGLLSRIGKEILSEGNFTGLIEGAISFAELNSLAVRKLK